MNTLLQINETVNVGSTGRIASQIGDLAIIKGWHSIVAYGREKRQCNSQLIRVGGKNDVLWHVLLTRLFDRHGLASLRYQLTAHQEDRISLQTMGGEVY